MDALNFQWYSERTQSRAELIELMQAQVAALERKVDAFERQSIQNSYYQQQNNYTPNYYHPGWQDHSNYSWNSQDQFYAPEIYYQQEFQYQPPPPQEEKQSNLEIITKLIERNEVSMTNQEESLRNIGNYLEQIANAINNWPQDTLPSNTKIDSKEESKELCETDSLENGKKVQEAVKRNLKRQHPDMEEDFEVKYKRRKIETNEEKDEDDQALISNVIKQTSPMLVSHQVQNSEEYIRVDLGEGKENNLDEFKFGGDRQFCKDAMEIKEKTTRRHEKIIFAIEPD